LSAPEPELEPPASGEVEPTPIAAFYDEYWGEQGRPQIPTPPPAVARLMRARIAPGSTCLDVGCGNGQAGGLPLRAMGCIYIGVDVSAAAVAAARALGLDARQISDAIALPFADDTFDVVVATEVLEHLIFPLATLTEMMRVLKHGGIVLVTTPNVAYWRRRVDLAFGRWNPLGYPDAVARPWADPHLRFFTAGALRRMLREAGCVDVEVRGHGGSLLGDLPGIGKRFRKAEGSAAYRLLEGHGPSAFGCFFNAVGRKPGGPL
jgi:methionine biosynthesis protein MetW